MTIAEAKDGREPVGSNNTLESSFPARSSGVTTLGSPVVGADRSMTSACTYGESELARELAYVLISALLAVSLTVTLFDRYAYFEHFPVSATLNIGTTLVLSFFQIGLAATDLALALEKILALATAWPCSANRPCLRSSLP